MPRSLTPQIRALGFPVQDVRDIGLRGRPDSEVMTAAIAADAIIITRDRGFADPRGWPESFTAGIIFWDFCRWPCNSHHDLPGSVWVRFSVCPNREECLVHWLQLLQRLLKSVRSFADCYRLIRQSSNVLEPHRATTDF